MAAVVVAGAVAGAPAVAGAAAGAAAGAVFVIDKWSVYDQCRVTRAALCPTVHTLTTTARHTQTYTQTGTAAARRQ